jgi:hypothetical protein
MRPTAQGILASESHIRGLLCNVLGQPSLGNFEITDQEANKRTYRFPKTKVTVMTIADQKGGDQLAPWIQRVYDRFLNQIDIDGVADVSMIPKLFQPILREAFKKRLAYWGFLHIPAKRFNSGFRVDSRMILYHF